MGPSQTSNRLGWPFRIFAAIVALQHQARYSPLPGGSMQRLLAIAIATLCSIFPICAFAQEPSSFTVGTATAPPGQKVTGAIDVPAGSDAGMQIPVVVVRGNNPGPTLALVSGAHGTEYASIIALEGLIGSLDPTQISGTVIILPLVNIASFQQKVPHVNPVDNKSMNRFYPGKEDGTQTERASFLITREVVDKSDYLIDFHGGDLDESLRPYSYWVVSGNKKQDAVSKEMVLAFGLDHIIISDDRPKDKNASKYLDNTATTRGKPTITVEAGYAGTVETDDVAALVQGTRSVMRLLKMLPGTPHAIDHPVWIKSLGEVTSPADGIFYPLVKRDTYVEAGRKLGDVTDYFGKVIFEARAPVSGIILHICAVPSMKKGDNIANIGVIAPKAP
jgi:predicted deacylase